MPMTITEKILADHVSNGAGPTEVRKAGLVRPQPHQPSAYDPKAD